MKIIKVQSILTDSAKESFEVAEMKGLDAPHAYHINYKNHGFAKFLLDDKTLSALEKDLLKIESSMSRKQLYSIMEDMLKQNHLCGARLLDIIKTQLVGETAVDVISSVMRGVVPLVIKNYIPLEIYEKTHHDIFELYLDGILASGTIKDMSTKHLVLDSILTSARNEDHIQLLIKWFKEGAIFTTKGKKLEDVDLSLKHKHEIMKQIWGSDVVTLKEKEELMAML
jgi:hypothetical protein